MMREIVVDTETTGMKAGYHRVCEIGAVELINRIETGRAFQTYVRPPIPPVPEAVKVHGLTMDFLQGAPAIEQVIEDFLWFVGSAPLIAHNAQFDQEFLDNELRCCGREVFTRSRFIDTLELDKRRNPGSKHSLDAICRRLKIDLTGRDLHGTLIDCALLSRVYVYLMGGLQHKMDLQVAERRQSGEVAERRHREPRPHAATGAEMAAHAEFLKSLKGDLIWHS